MDTVLIGLISAAVIVLLFLLLTRRKEPSLPRESANRTSEPTEGAAKAPITRGPEPDEAAGDFAEANAAETTAGGRTPTTDEADAAETPVGEALVAPDGAAADKGVEKEASAPRASAERDAAESGGSDPSRGANAALRKGLANTRGGFISRLAKLFRAKETIDASLLEEIEEVLITADVGVKTTNRILERLRKEFDAGGLDGAGAVWRCLKDQAREILNVEGGPLQLTKHKPSLLLIAGVNGVGKTTTIGKLASKYKAEGRRVLLAAGDTFRAAAVLQLEVWGQRVGCPVVKGNEGADPGSVIFEAIKQAQRDGYDLVIADTAGRLHTKQPLMEELKKLQKTVSKALGDRPADEILLVLDSTTGQNAVQQMYMFREALDISGVVLTKLDGTAKGGVILGIVDEHRVPVRFIGLGEKVEDLREFDAGSFVDALFEKPDGETMAA